MAARRSAVTRFAHLRNKRWTVDDAEEVLTAWSRDGESLAGFAREHGVQVQRLQYWRNRLDRFADESNEADRDVDGLTFAPVVVRGVGAAPAAVVRVGGLEVEVHDPERVSVRWIAGLVREAGQS